MTGTDSGRNVYRLSVSISAILYDQAIEYESERQDGALCSLRTRYLVGFH